MREGRRRLCMVVHGPYPVGEPRVAREVRRALEEGFEVDVVALRRPGEPRQERIEGGQVIRLPLSHQRGASLGRAAAEYLGFTALASLRVALLALRRRYAIVQVHAPPDFLVACALLPKLRGARVILDVHDLSTDMFAMRFPAFPGLAVADAALRAVERWSARLADAVITVHEPYRQELARRGVPLDKVTVVMNTPDEALLPQATGGREKTGFRVVYHGTVTPPYGVELLVEAAARVRGDIPGLRVEVYGEGDSVPAIQARAQALGVADRLILSGRYLPYRAVLERVQGASLGVIPNLPSRLNRFALSSKLFEYVAMRIPVVCADLPTIRQHFGDEELLFFPPGDPDRLAEAIRQVAQDPEGAARRADAAYRRYERYRWSVQAERYAAILRALAPRGRRHPESEISAVRPGPTERPSPRGVADDDASSRNVLRHHRPRPHDGPLADVDAAQDHRS